MQEPGNPHLDLVIGLYGRDGSLPQVLPAPLIPLQDALIGISRISDELGQHALLGAARVDLPIRFGPAGQADVPPHANQAQASLSLGLARGGGQSGTVPVLPDELDALPLTDNRARRLRSIVRRVIREHRSAQRG